MSLMALMMLFIGACFHESELVIKNNSTGEAWVEVNGRDLYAIRPLGSTRLSYPSPRTLQIIYWGHHILPGEIAVDMNVSGGNHLSLQPNCGALRVHNSSNKEMRELRFSPAGQNNWSVNLLTTFLTTGDFVFISRTAGYYDIRIRDQHNNYFYVSAQHIELDKTKNFIFSGL